jgi:hypothetical protein
MSAPAGTEPPFTWAVPVVPTVLSGILIVPVARPLAPPSPRRPTLPTA